MAFQFQKTKEKREKVMVQVSKFKKALLGILCGAMVLSFAQPAMVESISTATAKADVATSTYYDYQWWKLWTYRNKITTSLYSNSTATGTNSTVLCAKNTTSTKQSYGYSYSKTLSASVSLGAKVPVKAVELEAGGSVSYSTTTTISASVSVPAKTTYYVKKRTDTKSNKYKNIIQNQYLAVNGNWYNNGSSSTVYSTVTNKYPTITITK